MPGKINADTPIASPSQIAQINDVSEEMVHSVAKRLNIPFHVTAARRRLATFNQAVRIDQHINSSRPKKK